MTKVSVTVTHRKGVFQPEGKVVHNGLQRLGFTVDGVEVQKRIVLCFASTDQEEIRNQVIQMCEAFLVNPVMEDYLIEFLPDA